MKHVDPECASLKILPRCSSADRQGVTLEDYPTTVSRRMDTSIVTHVLNRAAALPDLSRVVFRRSGGIKPALNKGWKLFKRQGLAGLKSKLAYYFNESVNYKEWVRRYDTLNDERRGVIRRRIETLAHKPLISVVMPTYNPEPQWLVEAIESVRSQLYAHWELCIADDASTHPLVQSILRRYSAEDPRIKVVFRRSHGHISIASNDALELATGEFIALLDHDDLLSEHALFWVADATAGYPEAHLIYSDEDKIDIDGTRSDPYFKCNWNQDLFYSHNLICHLGVYRTRLVRELGGFRKGFEGAQDYDLALRCIERLDPRHVVHIPRVLYHWRIHPGSTASGSTAKPYALGAGKQAIADHLQRQGIAAVVEPLIDLGMYRIRYQLPRSLPVVSLIIPTRNGFHLIRQCVASILRKTTYRNYEIIIVDNGSDDRQTMRYLESLDDSKVRVIRDYHPFNYSALNNRAVEYASGTIIGLLNNDIEVIGPEWLSEMVAHAVRPEVGAVGARLLYGNDTVQHAGVILGIGGVAGHAHKYLAGQQNGYFGRSKLIQSFSAVTAACLLIRKETYKRVGGLNEDLEVAFNDVDFCLRIRQLGYRNIYTPYAELYHHESVTRGYEDTPERIVRFERETEHMKQHWGDLLIDDPAYSPNLTLNHHDFSFAWPPRVSALPSSPQECAS